MTARAELEKERDFLLASLRDLEAEKAAGDVDAGDYERIRDGYTARAASVLRALEAGPDASLAAPARRARGNRRARRPAEAVPAGRSRRSLVVTTAIVVGIVGVSAWVVTASSGGRDAGQPMTGSVPQGPGGQVGQAIELERQGKAVEALKVYDAILAEDPGNAEALAYRGWLLKRAGLADEALATLDRAIAADPKYPDAHFFRGMVLYQDRDDPAGAAGEFQTFLASGPPAEMVPMVQSVLDRATADAARKGTPVTPLPPS
ncbi:MAG: tetratricopeptide repeat protein [Acidimicrobiales bacterium]